MYLQRIILPEVIVVALWISLCVMSDYAMRSVLLAIAKLMTFAGLHTIRTAIKNDHQDGDNRARTSNPCMFRKCRISINIQFSASLSPSRRYISTTRMSAGWLVAGSPM